MLKIILALLVVFISAYQPTCFANIEDVESAIINGQYKKALDLLSPLIKKGDARAQYNLAMIYENGQGVKRNYKKAAQLYTLSANQGYSLAQEKLIVMYAEGRGVKKDAKKAAELYLLSKNQSAIDQSDTSTSVSGVVSNANKLIERHKCDFDANASEAKMLDAYLREKNHINSMPKVEQQDRDNESPRLQ